MSQCELTVLMPCLNEAETVGICVRKARNYLDTRGIDGEILVADNGSTDGSQKIAAELGAQIGAPVHAFGRQLRIEQERPPVQSHRQTGTHRAGAIEAGEAVGPRIEVGGFNHHTGAADGNCEPDGGAPRAPGRVCARACAGSTPSEKPAWTMSAGSSWAASEPRRMIAAKPICSAGATPSLRSRKVRPWPGRTAA